MKKNKKKRKTALSTQVKLELVAKLLAGLGATLAGLAELLKVFL